MLNLKPHHRIHIPNGLAVLAAVLLLISSFADYSEDSEVNSIHLDAAPSAKVDSAGQEDKSDSAEHKHRGLNLGSLLFRRG